jgi:hypothetical protein
MSSQSFLRGPVLIKNMKPGPWDRGAELEPKLEVELDVEFVFASDKTGRGVRLRKRRR